MKSHNKNLRVLAIWLLLALLVTLFTHLDRESSETALENPAAGPKSNIGKEATPELRRSQPILGRLRGEAAEIVWEVGTPSPMIPHPRGQNETRRYQAPQHADIEPSLLARKAVMLAKLPEDGREEVLESEKDEYTMDSRRLVFDPAAFELVMRGQTARMLVPTTGEEMISLDAIIKVIRY